MPGLTKKELRELRSVRAAVLRAAKGASPDAPPNEITKFAFTGPSDDFMEKFEHMSDNQKIFDVRLQPDPDGTDSETDFIVYAYGKDSNGKIQTSERGIATVTLKPKSS
jgi:hypothetical protein